MRSVKTILNEGEEIEEKVEGLNLTKIYYIFCKCHSVPPVQQYYDKKKYKREIKFQQAALKNKINIKS
jgi:hypothetical protein